LSPLKHLMHSPKVSICIGPEILAILRGRAPAVKFLRN